MENVVEPLSLNDFEAQYGGGVEAFTVYCLGYWLQQNANRAGEQHYEEMRGRYERAA